MSLKIHLTTDEKPANDGLFEARIFTCEPGLDTPEPKLEEDGMWWHGCPVGHGPSTCGLLVGHYSREDLAALGFPKPGGIRVIEVGECEEGE